MKHITIDFHFVHDKVQNGTLHVSHVASTDQLVDALTKPQSSAHLQQLCVKLHIQPKPILRGMIRKPVSFEKQSQSPLNPP